jgi:adenine phosphoribosyltransferase
MERQDLLRSLIRAYPDWPTPGVLFQDLSPLMGDARGFATTIDLLAEATAASQVDAVVGIEARGWPWGAALAVRLGAGFVPLRKAGKLPGEVHSMHYALEYGTAVLELQSEALAAGHRVLLVDDVLATGGTAAAAVSLVRRAGADVVGVAVVSEIPVLQGRDRLPGVPVHALLAF